jgi:drug/metabolite transporter (DMT)-like permease
MFENCLAREALRRTRSAHLRLNGRHSEPGSGSDRSTASGHHAAAPRTMARVMSSPSALRSSPAAAEASLAAATAATAFGSKQLALLAGVVTVVVWGANFAVQKVLFAVLPPSGFLFARYLVMPACAAALLVIVARGRWPRLPRADALRLAGLGIVGHGIHVSLVTYGIHWSTAFSSALILACGPVFTLLILHLARIERLTRAQVLGVALACSGVLVFLSDKLLGRQWTATAGDLVLLFAASLFSYYTVMTKPLIQRHGGVAVMAYATLAGSVPVVLASAWPALHAPWAEMRALHWLLLLWASFVSAFLGWLVWGWVNERRGVARTAPLMYLMPLVAGLGGWLFTGERFGTVKLVGAALTLAGVAWAQFAAAAPPEAPAPRRTGDLATRVSRAGR